MGSLGSFIVREVRLTEREGRPIHCRGCRQTHCRVGYADLLMGRLYGVVVLKAGHVLVLKRLGKFVVVETKKK